MKCYNVAKNKLKGVLTAMVPKNFLFRNCIGYLYYSFYLSLKLHENRLDVEDYHFQIISQGFKL